MKLTPVQLEQQLTKNLSKIYIICGDEPFLTQEVWASIRKKAESMHFTERMRLDIETDADLETIYRHAYTPPFFGQKRVLEVHWKGNKLTKSAQPFLQKYAENPSPHTLMLIRLGKIDSKTEQTKWFKALEKLCAIVSIWPLPAKQLPSWIMQRAKAQNLQLTADAAQLLAHYVEGNLHAAAQEIEKLSLWGETTIDRNTVEKLVVDQGCFNAFDLVNHSFAGNGSQALRVLHYLQNEGTEPLMILGAFAHELRSTAKIAKELKKGNNLSSVLAQYRVHFSRQQAMRDFLTRCKYADCLHLLLKVGEIDRIIKGALPGHIWQALRELSLCVAGVAQLPTTIYN